MRTGQQKTNSNFERFKFSVLRWSFKYGGDFSFMKIISLGFSFMFCAIAPPHSNSALEQLHCPGNKYSDVCNPCANTYVETSRKLNSLPLAHFLQSPGKGTRNTWISLNFKEVAKVVSYPDDSPSSYKMPLHKKYFERDVEWN